METNSRKLIRMLEKDGWVLERVTGDHHTFKHPQRPMLITVTHPRRDLPCGEFTSSRGGDLDCGGRRISLKVKA